jgi:HlyD family secretion protein
MDFYAQSQKQSTADVARAEADLKYQKMQSSNQIAQAEATLASSQAEVTQGEADLENATLTLQRETDLYHRGVDPVQAFDQARTSAAALGAHVESLRKQVVAAQAAVGLAKASADQIDAKRAALTAMEHQSAAAAAQSDLAQVRLNYTEVRAPTNGIVNVRAALQGEVVTLGQAIVTLINPNDLWVRADLEETYIDRVRLGDELEVRLPSGATRRGTVFYRGIDADYATQRDVSRSKRDIKTFEIRIRCDNHDGALAVGMTAFVTVPLEKR